MRPTGGVIQGWLSDLFRWLADLLPYILGLVGLILLLSIADRHRKRDDTDER